MVLGKKGDGQKRFKATAEHFPGEGPSSIADAYDALSRHAFAVWMRLAVASSLELKGGRTGMADVIGYSGRRANEVLLELERKGFVSFIVNGVYRPTEIVIERRPMICRGDRFVREQ